MEGGYGTDGQQQRRSPPGLSRDGRFFCAQGIDIGGSDSAPWRMTPALLLIFGAILVVLVALHRTRDGRVEKPACAPCRPPGEDPAEGLTPLPRFRPMTPH